MQTISSESSQKLQMRQHIVPMLHWMEQAVSSHKQVCQLWHGFLLEFEHICKGVIYTTYKYIYLGKIKHY